MMQRYFLSLLGVFLAATTFMVLAEGKEKRYNVLSIGSRHYYGLLTARFIDYMEMKAFLIADQNKCAGLTKAEKDNEKIAMTELFDYIAGSDSGAIIAGSLLMQNDKEEAVKLGGQ